MIGKRLKSLIEAINSNQKNFAKRIKIQPNTLNHYLTGRRNVPTDILIVIQKHTKCNLNWLLTGKGEMFHTNKCTRAREGPKIKELEAEIAELKYQLRQVEGENHALSNELMCRMRELLGLKDELLKYKTQ